MIRIFSEEISAEEAERSLLSAPGFPALFKGYAKRWRAFERWNWKFLRERLGQDEVVVGDKIGATKRGKKMRLAEFIDWILSGAGPAEEPRWYTLQYSPFADHPELLKDFAFPEFCRTLLDFRAPAQKSWYLRKFGWLFIGPAGTETLPHADLFSTHAWLAQLVGRKRVSLRGLAGAEGLAASEDVELEPGDVLLIPAGRVHSAQSLEPSVTLSFNFVNHTNHLAFLDAIARDPEAWRLRREGP